MNLNQPPLNSLFISFVKQHGGDDFEVPKGDVLEFVAGDFVVLVRPKPTNSELCVFEIQIRGLALEDPSQSAQALLMMHRINNTARFEHKWTISIDEDDMLLISTAVPIISLNDESFEEEIADGLHRAKALHELWLDARERDAMSTPPENSSDASSSFTLPLDRA